MVFSDSCGEVDLLVIEQDLLLAPRCRAFGLLSLQESSTNVKLVTNT